jgi:hypothetical protein
MTTTEDVGVCTAACAIPAWVPANPSMMAALVETTTARHSRRCMFLTFLGELCLLARPTGKPRETCLRSTFVVMMNSYRGTPGGVPSARDPSRTSSVAFAGMKNVWHMLVPGLIAGTCVLAVPSTTSTVDRLAACGRPANILDLTNWKETLPTGSKGAPTEIKQPNLANYSVDPWFTPNTTCDGVQFRAAVNGVTTSGSKNPRSELREMTNGGSDEASWSTTSGTSTMVIDEAVTHLPSDKAQVVVGQIHNQHDDVTVFRLEGSKLYVTKGNDTHYQLVTDNYHLGTRFTAKFVASGGQIKAYYNNTLAATLKVASSGDYFKTGVYTQANCGNSSPCKDSNYGEAVIYGLTVSHER